MVSLLKVISVLVLVEYPCKFIFLDFLRNLPGNAIKREKQTRLGMKMSSDIVVTSDFSLASSEYN